MPTSAVEMIGLSLDIVDTKRKNAKSVDHVSDMGGGGGQLTIVQSVERLACVSLSCQSVANSFMLS